jgi:uncharacterized protein YfaA (DUF2138 family)
MPKRDPFVAAVTAARKAADGKAIGAALGKLVGAKLVKPKATTPRYGVVPVLGKPKAVKQRSGARRLGKFQRYTPTAKPDVQPLRHVPHAT